MTNFVANGLYKLTKTTNLKGQVGGILVYCTFDKIVELAELKLNPKSLN